MEEVTPRSSNKRRRQENIEIDSNLPSTDAATLPSDILWLTQQDPYIWHYVIREMMIIDLKDRGPRKQIPKRNLILGPSFLWRDAPELEEVLSRRIRDFYSCVGDHRANLVERTLSELEETAKEHEYTFELGGNKGLKSRVRSFFNTLWQGAKKKILREAENELLSLSTPCRATISRILDALLQRIPSSLQELASQHPTKPEYTKKTIETILLLIPETKSAVLINSPASNGKHAKSDKKAKTEEKIKSLETKVTLKSTEATENTSKKPRLVIPIELIQQMNVPPQSHMLWKEDDQVKVQIPDDVQDTRWIEAPVETSEINFVWKRYTRLFPNQLMLDWMMPSQTVNDVLRQAETFATLVRVRLTSGLVRSGLGVCHQRLIRLYQYLEESLQYDRPDHVLVWRYHVAACWCLYAHTWLEFENFLAVPDVAKLRKAAVAILSSATHCPLVGNHAWLTIALARLVGKMDSSAAVGVLWDGIDRAKAYPAKPRILLRKFEASDVTNLNISPKWTISALRKDRVTPRHLQDSLQKVLELPSLLPQSAYVVVDKSSQAILMDEIKSYKNGTFPENDKVSTFLPRFSLQEEHLEKHKAASFKYTKRPIDLSLGLKPPTKIMKKITPKPPANTEANGVSSTPTATATNFASSVGVPETPRGPAPQATTPLSTASDSIANGNGNRFVRLETGKVIVAAKAETPTAGSEMGSTNQTSSTTPNAAIEVEQVCSGCNSFFSAESMLLHSQRCLALRQKAQISAPQSSGANI